MARYTPKVLFWLYRFLVLRDTEQCLLCSRKPGKGRRLEIDHMDTNPQNDDPDNLCLLCPQCNKRLEILNPAEHKKILRKRYVQFVCESVCVRGNPSTLINHSEVDYSKGSPEMQANSRFENPYREWILERVRLHGYYPKEEAINSGAEEIGCSPASASRYLVKLTSESGVLDIFNSPQRKAMLRLKPDKTIKFHKNGQVKVDDLIMEVMSHRSPNPTRTRTQNEGVKNEK